MEWRTGETWVVPYIIGFVLMDEWVADSVMNLAAETNVLKLVWTEFYMVSSTIDLKHTMADLKLLVAVSGCDRQRTVITVWMVNPSGQVVVILIWNGLGGWSYPGSVWLTSQDNRSGNSHLIQVYTVFPLFSYIIKFLQPFVNLSSLANVVEFAGEWLSSIPESIQGEVGAKTLS